MEVDDMLFARKDGRVFKVKLRRVGGVLVYERRDDEKNRCWRPVGWAYDERSFEYAVKAGVHAFVIVTECARYTCPVSSALKHAIDVDFGCGPQKLIPMSCWKVEKKTTQKPEQLTLFGAGGCLC